MELPGTRTAVATEPAKLPLELLFQIIERVPPANPDAILPASHISTKTLLSLTRVSRATYALACRLLRERCMYLDSSRRVADVLLCMSRLVPTMPQSLSLRSITSLYLAPFGASLDDAPTAKLVRDLFYEVSDTLRRLVISMPFASFLAVDDRNGIHKTLRLGFEQLCGLEEFSCVGDYPELSMAGGGTTDVWRLWPELRRLLLFDVPLDDHWLWWNIATLEKLQNVVLAQVEDTFIYGDHIYINVKEAYFGKLPPGDDRLRRRINVVFLDAAMDFRTSLNRSRWRELDPEGLMTVQTLKVPRRQYPRDKSDDADEEWDDVGERWDAVVDFTRRKALDGSLWDPEGPDLLQWEPDKVMKRNGIYV